MTKTPDSIKNTNSAADSQASDPHGAGRPIRLTGVRVHNLKNLSLSIPRNKVVAIAGPSGSGKSSLAFDTIFAEGQRQYIESLSVYSRQFLHQLERPDVDAIEGLQPTIAIDQRVGSGTPRGTVATETEIYDFLRVLYARIGQAYCYRCGRPIKSQTPEEIAEEISRLSEGTRVILLAPVVRGTIGKHQEILRKIVKAGFVRARIDGLLTEIEKAEELDPKKPHTIEAVIDRLILRPGVSARLLESIKLALKHGDNLLTCLYEKERLTTEAGTTKSIWKEILFSALYCCPKCKISYAELRPRTFSFNSPYGVCPDCQGLGKQDRFDPELIIPDRSLTIAEGALAPMKMASAPSLKRYRKLLEQWRGHLAEQGDGTDWTERPLEQWPEKLFTFFLYGPDKPSTPPGYAGRFGAAANHSSDQSEDTAQEPFLGLIPLVDEIYAEKRGKKETAFLETLRATLPCRACGGSRVRPEARCVLIAEKRIHEVTAMTIDAALAWFEELPDKLEPTARSIAESSIRQIVERLRFMHRVGLDYLTLDRSSDTLSGGELQRVRLANGLGNGLVGICYILDEPSTGLHPCDNYRLIDAMRDLQKRGNSVLVVEHDEAIIRQADWLIDLGPSAGARGGRILAEGTPEEVAREAKSLTGRYLSGVESIPLPKKRRRPAKTRSLVLEGATTNNLKNITVTFPLGTFICVTGVSGSGKSSLLNETLIPALSRRLGLTGGPRPGNHKGLRGVAQIDKLIRIDQTPIGRSPRSNPATYCGVFDEIRKVFAGSRDARLRGYQIGRFSFNVAGGRCEACQGQGVRKVEMHFLPDMYAVCPECEGKRFNAQTLEIKYKGKSIADVLDMPVDEAIEFFSNHVTIARLLEGLKKVGLGYIPIGQPSTTLSGGEAQRVKLAAELSRVETGSTLYVLDEPTSGLHVSDTRQLLEVLSNLVDLGNTVIVIEHNLDVVKTADWIIDLGPEGGRSGGELLFAGTPEELVKLEGNATAKYLRGCLEGQGAAAR